MKSIAGFLLPEFPFLRISEKEDSPDWPADLAQVCGEKHIVEIGKAYLRLAPLENDINFLHELISGKNLTSEKESIEQDFASGKMVVIHGWIISITEARQCALLYLTV